MVQLDNNDTDGYTKRMTTTTMQKVPTLRGRQLVLRSIDENPSTLKTTLYSPADNDADVNSDDPLR